MNLRRFRKRMLLVLYVLCIPVIAYTTYLTLNRSLHVSDVAYAETGSDNAFEVARDGRQDASYDVRIPLPADAHVEDITFENRYAEHRILLSVRTDERAFYVDHAVLCEEETVPHVFCLLQEDGEIGILLSLNALYVPAFRLENDAVYISLQTPAESAEHIIIIDPAYTGAGGDVALALARQLQQALLEAPLSCKVFLTRTDAHSLSAEGLLSLIEETGASRYIRLVMPEGEAVLSAYVGMYDGFYIRDYGNAPFAADVMRALTAVDGLRADGIRTVSDDETLSAVKIPAVSVHIEGVRSAFGEEETRIEELALALSTALRLGLQSGSE